MALQRASTVVFGAVGLSGGSSGAPHGGDAQLGAGSSARLRLALGGGAACGLRAPGVLRSIMTSSTPKPSIVVIARAASSVGEALKRSCVGRQLGVAKLAPSVARGISPHSSPRSVSTGAPRRRRGQVAGGAGVLIDAWRTDSWKARKWRCARVGR